MRTLQTERLSLTPVTVRNAQALWQILQAPGLRRFQDLPSVGAGTFTAMVGKRPKRLDPRSIGRFEWLVLVNEEDAPAGWVSLRISEREPAIGEIGYSLLTQFRGRGIAAEAVRALITEAFREARLRAVRAYCVPENTESRRLLERVGFEPDGVLPHGASVNGQPVDVLAHAIPRARWVQSGKTIETPASV